jgi:hypothetical protein
MRCDALHTANDQPCSTTTSDFAVWPGPTRPCHSRLHAVHEQHCHQADAEQHGADDRGAREVVLLQALEDEHGCDEVLR